MRSRSRISPSNFILAKPLAQQSQSLEAKRAKLAASTEKLAAQAVAARAACQEAADWLDAAVLLEDQSRAELESCEADLQALMEQSSAVAAGGADERCMEIDDDGLAQTPEEVFAIAQLLADMRAPGGGRVAPRAAPPSLSPAAMTTPVSRKRVSQGASTPLSAQVDTVEDSDQELVLDSPPTTALCLYGKAQGRSASAARAAADPYNQCSPLTPQALEQTKGQQAAAPESPRQDASGPYLRHSASGPVSLGWPNGKSDVTGDSVFGQGAVIQATVQ